MRKSYPTDLTDSQWENIVKLLPRTNRKRKVSLREVFNALLYITENGCKWRCLPHDFPEWTAVRYYFDQWTKEKVFEAVQTWLVIKVRKLNGKDPSPTLGIVDSQSIRTTFGGKERGYDGNKKIKGRKRHIVVDTLGLILAVIITPANRHDAEVVHRFLKLLRCRFSKLTTILGDAAYGKSGVLRAVMAKWGFDLEISIRPEQKFVVIPKRWIVERTIAWLDGYRRLCRDYEFTPEASKSFVLLASISMMRKKL